MYSPNILIVDDDDAGVGRLIADVLSLEGWRIKTACGGEEALKSMAVEMPDVVLLDILMQEMDGCETLRRIRLLSSVPVIMLSARTAEEDKVKCLTMGADDFITKPFGLKELIARIQAALRHHYGKSVGSASGVFTFDELQIDFDNLTIASGGQHFKLTRTENRLLFELVKNAGKVLGFDHLLSSVWGAEYKGQRDYLYVFIRHLRLKIEAAPENPLFLKSITGIGYIFETPPESSGQGG